MSESSRTEDVFQVVVVEVQLQQSGSMNDDVATLRRLSGDHHLPWSSLNYFGYFS